MQIADVFARLLIDDREAKQTIEQDLPRSADKGGKAAGKRFGSSMGTAAKATLGGLAGALAGATFAIATKGALELDAALATFRAETGATEAEIESAQGTIADLYKSNLQGFSQISDAMAALRTQQGLTQQGAEELTQTYLDFANATNQDAAAAVSSFDDILDSWGLKATDAAGIMDVLVLSHQRYGGQVDENQRTLAALAPAMKAANMEIDDGIAILNLFGAKGLDAQMASAAFAKALTKVKSPEELQKLIDDISATEDPFLRAQKAADLFGARAGAKLANALAGADLDEYKVSLEEAAGAATEAGDAIKNSLGNKAKLLLKSFGGELAKIGTNFGPLLLGFSSLLPMLGPVMTTLGGGLGALLAAAIPAGMALLPVLLIAAIVAAVVLLAENPEIADAALGMAETIVDGLIAGLEAFPEWLTDTFVPWAVGAVADLIPKLVSLFATLIPKLAVLWAKLVLAVGGMIVKLIGKFAGAVPAIVGHIAGLVGQVVGLLLSIPGRIAGLVWQLLGVFARAGGQVLGAVGRAVGQIVDAFFSIPGKLVGLGPKIVQTIINGLVGLPGALAKAVGDAMPKIELPIPKIDIPKIELPSFKLPFLDTGAWNIPTDTLAMVHRGEMVVPRYEAEMIRTGRASVTKEPGGTGGQEPPGGNTYVVNVEGVLKARSPLEVATQLRRLADFGVLP